jgi:hypothetical protein
MMAPYEVKMATFSLSPVYAVVRIVDLFHHEGHEEHEEHEGVITRIA